MNQVQLKRAEEIKKAIRYRNDILKEMDRIYRNASKDEITEITLYSESSDRRLTSSCSVKLHSENSRRLAHVLSKAIYASIESEIKELETEFEEL